MDVPIASANAARPSPEASRCVRTRRAKQFAMVGPGTKGRLDVGLNLKGAEAGDRLEVLPPGGMCQARLFVTDAAQVDDELMGWVRTAYDAAG